MSGLWDRPFCSYLTPVLARFPLSSSFRTNLAHSPVRCNSVCIRVELGHQLLPIGSVHRVSEQEAGESHCVGAFTQDPKVLTRTDHCLHRASLAGHSTEVQHRLSASLPSVLSTASSRELGCSLQGGKAEYHLKPASIQPQHWLAASLDCHVSHRPEQGSLQLGGGHARRCHNQLRYLSTFFCLFLSSWLCGTFRWPLSAGQTGNLPFICLPRQAIAFDAFRCLPILLLSASCGEGQRWRCSLLTGEQSCNR